MADILSQEEIDALLEVVDDDDSEEPSSKEQESPDQLQEGAAMAKDQMDASQMVAAWRQIGLACGFYEPEVNIARPSAVSQGAMARYQAMGDAELAGLVEAGSA
jgi:hypothetical protein